ncbi:DUF3537 domain-containing protein [Quillaja saponaria]|uniref:DUF3537 domain-containing protein n=1 Tax=Quillaja saponaria TaxID=32244 RepID=A0AAD7P807_QUISA|nr:DUF3537 domain-containing protein [Quillaja saponaria]
MLRVMANPHVRSEEPPAQTPLLDSNSNQNRTQEEKDPLQEPEQESQETPLDQTLRRLEKFLTSLGFNQSSVLGFLLSWTAFIVVGVVVPVLVLVLVPSDCSGCEKYQIKDFELCIVVPQACLAAISLLCFSFNLRKYGLRRFLFVDRYSGQMARLRDRYIKQISGSLRLLAIWVFLCFILKTAREVIHIIYVHQESWWVSLATLLALVTSWTYVSTISLSASILFHLVCNLQVIHFDDYGKLLESESNVFIFMEEHIRLRYYLSKISHRFRIFLVLEFLVVTASQFITLLQITEYGSMITIINGGDFAVSTIVQVVGVIICLHAATKISHRAQAIASLASRWHALVTSASTDASQQRIPPSLGNLEAANQVNLLYRNYSESDLESLDSVGLTTQPPSHASSYHKRQAFVMYLQSNPGGITIFGWTVDRTLINTIFFIELSLVTLVLGKTIIFN